MAFNALEYLRDGKEKTTEVTLTKRFGAGLFGGEGCRGSLRYGSDV